MKQIRITLCAMLAVAMMSVTAMAADAEAPANLKAKIAAADQDFQQRFLSLTNFHGELTSAAVGFDIDKPGMLVSYKKKNGNVMQYGTSMTPREYYQGVLQGGGDGE